MTTKRRKHYVRGIGKVALSKEYRKSGHKYKLKRIMKIRGAILGELAEVKAKKRRRHKR